MTDYKKFEEVCENMDRCENCPLNYIDGLCSEIQNKVLAISAQQEAMKRLKIQKKAKKNIFYLGENELLWEMIKRSVAVNHLIGYNFNFDNDMVSHFDEKNQMLIVDDDVIFDFIKLEEIFNKYFNFVEAYKRYYDRFSNDDGNF